MTERVRTRSEPVADVAVVTGASGGFGSEISESVSRLSRITVLVGRNRGRLEAAAARCSGDVRTIVADLNIASELDAIYATVTQLEPKRIAVIAAAGVVGPIALPGTENPSAWESAILTNVMGTFRTVQPFLSLMRANNWGRVIVLSSAQTLHGPDPVMTAYATSKLALNAYTACLASNFESTGISACAIHPGDAYTRMGEEIRLGAESVGRPAAHLTEWAKGAAADIQYDLREAGDLVGEILVRPASWSNGCFLMVPSSIEHHPRSPWAMALGPRQ